MKEQTYNELLYFIINPTSGKGKKVKSFIEAINYYLKERSILNYQMVYTERAGHAVDIAKKIKNSHNIKMIIVVGGDGTLHEVINGAYPTNIPIGYIPSGSGNDYAREMGISKDPIEALEKILKTKEKLIDIAKINGEYFINVAGIGLDGLVAKLSNQSSLKKYLGKSIYIYGLIKGLITFKPMDITLNIDGKNHFYNRVWLVAIANGRYYGGGMQICPNAKHDDGQLDICIVNNVSRFEILKLFPTVFTGKHIFHPNVNMHRGENVKLTSTGELDVQTDGESLNIEQIEVEIIKGKITIV